MYSKITKSTILSTGISLAALLIATPLSFAQKPAPSPSPIASDERFTVTSSAEFGIRGLVVNGNGDKFRSDLNYHAGFRVFDSSYFVQDNSKGSKVFDIALVTTSGWSADPQGSIRLNMAKAGSYNLDADIRRVRYFNNLNTHVVTWSQPVSTRSQHAMDTLHHFGDFDLTVFPDRENFRMRFGYSFNHTDGPGFSFNTVRFPSSSSDEFQVNSTIHSSSQDLRAGVDGKLLGFNLGFTYGHRNFNDKTQFFVDALNQGNNPAPTTASINRLTRLMPTKGATDFGNFYVQRTFAKTLDFTGRFIYAESDSNTTQSDTINGRASATGNIIVLDAITAPGRTKRPQARSDVGLTWRPTDNLRISNTFTFDQFSISGEGSLTEFLQRTTSGGVPVPNSLTTLFGARNTAYRRFSNLVEEDYQVNRMFSFNIGYRYTHRRIAADSRDISTAGPATLGTDLFSNTTHSVIAGTKIRPYKNWSIYADVERGTSDNVFTRLANNKLFNFRIRSVANLKKISFNVSAIVKNNDNPGTSKAVAGIPATETIADTRTRIFSGSVDWTPLSELSFSSGYTYNQQTSLVDIILPVGAPDFPTSAYRFGTSAYYLRDSYFFFDISARPIKRVSFYASYRLDNDTGQGDRVVTRPQDIISSYPIRFHMPEARLAIRLTRNIDWNIGYQYYSYRERQYINPFATTTATTPATLVPQIVEPQNYTAHMPYTSLRIYFGRAAGDR
jgi:hypothetical protein